MKKKLIIVIIILLIVALGFLSYGLFLRKSIIFANDDLCNLACLDRGYDRGVCNNGLKLIEGEEAKSIGKCEIQECPGSDSCGCTCLT